MGTRVFGRSPASGASAAPAMAARPDWVIDLAAADPTMIASVGGKAANLGEMMAAGFPVPPGFCVTTHAYAAAAQSVSINFDEFEGASPDRLMELAQRTRESFKGASVPPGILKATMDAYCRLGSQTAVAVRSSATAEDLPNASFAGQQDTYLNVVGPDAVLDAIQRCWASLWTDRAVVYRAKNGIDQRAVRLAVVVQKMVQAEIAGVLFTANPLTGRRRQAVIDASPGLGEAIVSGAVNPDHFVVDTLTGKIAERVLGDKRFEVRSLPGGGVEHREVSRAEDIRACVTDDQICALAELGSRVESHFGAPQDIEWAIDSGGSLWLTQARPITTLFPIPSTPSRQARKGGDDRVYFCFSVAQGLYRPLTPMGLAGLRLIASAAAELFGIPVEDRLAGPPAYAEGGERMFIDLTGTLRSKAGRAIFPRMLDVMEARSANVLRRLCEDPRFSLSRHSWIPFLKSVARVAWQYKVPFRVLGALLNPANACRDAEREGMTLRNRLQSPVNATHAERLDFAEAVLSNEVMAAGARQMPRAAAGLAMLAVVNKLLGGNVSEEELQTILRGLPNNITTEMDLMLWQLARSIREDKESMDMMRDVPVSQLVEKHREGKLPRRIQEGLTDFLSQFGHRAVAEIDIGIPRWSDDPTHILGVLANYLRLENSDLAPDVMFKRGEQEAEAMVETLVARARKSGWLRSKLVRFALDRCRRLAGLRELPKYNIIVILAAARRQLMLVGAELERLGRIKTADDVFFLSLKEARQGLNGSDLRGHVEEHKERYELELKRRRVPRVVLSDGTDAETTFGGSQEGAGLKGTPASAGRVTGIARVILDPAGAHLEPGEILVAPSTDPGWTPLFLTAGGLVMEMGGANSHGAVVAREYGIPAVVGAPDAAQRIVTGQRITVDGSSGVITIE